MSAQAGNTFCLFNVVQLLPDCHNAFSAVRAPIDKGIVPDNWLLDNAKMGQVGQQSHISGDLAPNVIQVRHPTPTIASHVEPFTHIKVGRPGRCVAVRAKVGSRVEEPQGAQCVAFFPQRLFVVHSPYPKRNVLDEPSDDPLFGANPARIRQCSTRERNVVDTGEDGTGASSSSSRTTSRPTYSRRRSQHRHDHDHDATSLSL